MAVLQNWVLAACTVGGAGQGVGDRLTATAVVRSSPLLSAHERLAIYRRGYLSRLLECLRAEYPVLRALVGDQVFDLFAEGYLVARPPESPSLFELGAGFADHLEATRPRPTGPADAPDALPAALARLERAGQQARHALGVESDPDHAPIDLVTVLAPGARVRTPDSLRLLSLAFPLMGALEAVDRGERPHPPAPATTHHAVARRRYRVRTHVLCGWQHDLLSACAEGEVPLAGAVVAAAAASGLDPSAVWAGLLSWLPAAVDAGMATVTTTGRGAGTAHGPGGVVA